MSRHIACRDPRWSIAASRRRACQQLRDGIDEIDLEGMGATA